MFNVLDLDINKVRTNKICSLFFVFFMTFFGSFYLVKANGIDSFEVLSDGTKVTHISSERMADMLQEFRNRRQQNLGRRFTVRGNLGMKAGSLLCGGVLFSMCRNIESSCFSLGLKLISVAISVFTFFYPDYIDWDVRKKDGESSVAAYDHENPGLKFILDELERHNDCLNGRRAYPGLDPNQGFIIVERPRSKWHIPNTVLSGVYFQDDSSTHVVDRLRHELQTGG